MKSNPPCPVPTHSPNRQSDVPSPAALPHSPPCWATQARCDLAQAEAELRCLQERHVAETESLKRGVERAILGARREERRLLERVEQDHRDTQQHLEQVQKENMAAARVSQSLLDKRLRKLAQLQQQIQEVGQQSGVDQSQTNHNLLLKEVTELIQPWEISLSLKKVTFKPSSQPNAVTFGDIRVQEQSLCLHVGGCGSQGQLCALHSEEMECGDKIYQTAGEDRSISGQGWTSPTGRVVRKISLSTRSGLEPEEEPTRYSPKTHPCLSKCEQSDWESSQDDEMDLTSFEPQGEDGFLAVPRVLNTRDYEGKMSNDGKHCSASNQRKALIMVSGHKPSKSPEQVRKEHTKLGQCLSLDRQDGDRGIVRDSNGRFLKYSQGILTSPRMTPREPLSSQSCLDLTSRGRPQSCLSQSSDEHSLGTLCDSGRASSPTDSLDSSYTFIVSSSPDYNMNRGTLSYGCRLSKSVVDLTHRTRPLISGGTNEHGGVWRVRCSNLNSMTSITSPTLRRQQRTSDMGQAHSYTTRRSLNIDHQPQRRITLADSKQPQVAKSLSMSVIDGSSQFNRCRGETALVELEEEGDPSFSWLHTRGGHLIRQFGKQGSGRADFTLPSGIHATPQGQLFIVDCGNTRVQVCV